MNYHTNPQGEKIFYTGRPDSFFEVNMCGYTAPNPEYSVYRFKSAIHTFEYVISGTGYIETEGESEKKTVNAGDFYLLSPGFTGHYYPDPERPFSKIWANVRGSFIDRMADIYGVEGFVTVVHDADKRIFDDLKSLCELFAAHEGEDLSEPYRQSSLRLADILSIVRKQTPVYTEEVRSAALRIHDYLDLHICDEVTLPMIAEAMYMHEATVIRVFKEKYGTTPMKTLNSMRIEAAKRMLLENIPVKNVAEMLKFSDASYFSLCFKKETGMTPAQFVATPKNNGIN